MKQEMMKLITLVVWLRMHGAIPPIPHLHGVVHTYSHGLLAFVGS
jgi:hypothetical protein